MILESAYESQGYPLHMAVTPQQQILGLLPVPYPPGHEPAIVNSDLARVEARGTEKAR